MGLWQGGCFHSQKHQVVIDLPWSPHLCRLPAPVQASPSTQDIGRFISGTVMTHLRLKVGLGARDGEGGTGYLAKGSCPELCPRSPSDHAKRNGCMATLKGPTRKPVTALSAQGLPGKRQWLSQEPQGEKNLRIVSNPNSIRGLGMSLLEAIR